MTNWYDTVLQLTGLVSSALLLLVLLVLGPYFKTLPKVRNKSVGKLCWYCMQKINAMQYIWSEHSAKIAFLVDLNSVGDFLFFSVCSSCYYYCCLEGDVPTISGTSSTLETVQDWLCKIVYLRNCTIHVLTTKLCHNYVSYFEIDFVRRKIILWLSTFT